jgi:hypothetical protein
MEGAPNEIQNFQEKGTDQDFLKAKLLEGTLSIEDFRKEIQKLDQRTPQRVDAEANRALLSDSVVKDFIYLHGTEVEIANYHMALGFATFHVAQGQLLNNNDTEKGLELMNEALEHSMIAAPEERFAYTRATIAYLEGDLETLRSFENDKDIIHENNRKIVSNFIKGLEKRGYPHYGKDYTIQEL